MLDLKLTKYNCVYAIKIVNGYITKNYLKASSIYISLLRV